MSSNRRRNSSRQLLQNLIRVTAQRSQEDAEEVEREQRRRAREFQRGEGGPACPEPTHHHDDTHRTELDGELKPGAAWFWRRTRASAGVTGWRIVTSRRCSTSVVRERTPSTAPRWKPGPEEEKQDEEERRELEGSSRPQETLTRPAEKIPCSKKEVRTSYSSSVFLPQDARLQHATGHPADRASYLAAGTMRPRGAACRVDGEVEQEELREEEEEEAVQPALQKERRSADTRQSCGDEEDQEEEELSFTREERDDLTSGGSREREEEEEVEGHKTPNKGSVETTRRVEVNRRSASSLCSEGEEPLNYGPMSPTFKKLLIQFYPDEINSRVSTDGKCTIIERTESLRRSTGSIKKTSPPVAVSKIDKKRELYTQALELSSKEGRSGAQLLTDLTSPTEPVAAKKNLFEAGDAWNQNTSVPASKDADGLKVGVADLINQWVRGGEDGSRCSSPSKPAEIKPGGVLNKKNLWESFGDTFSPGRDGKESSSGKKYKFVVTSHGKYEKVSVDEDENCLSAGEFYEDL
ncbi:LOW QUALITY PROTEIN: lymphocyte-specific protein 1-like [Hippoglossus hippoglossus]|uniref:LOW QUALITY PROTEIN: lymphocyte-specific protein 1-like n=1 Tax=Hippoglossus hippoglossus TaxID=8267 RepID=UPI00148C78F7|nr:LOW QUALITY PROTEIN: lymphocyte-specific protein 1-like [Hippoglossus hippoglossus]